MRIAKLLKAKVIRSKIGDQPGRSCELENGEGWVWMSDDAPTELGLAWLEDVFRREGIEPPDPKKRPRR